MSRWREEPRGHVLRGFMGTLKARVNFTGSLWRGTVWNLHGTSSATHLTIQEAISWCDMELGR